MKKFPHLLSGITMAACLMFGTHVIAQTMSATDFKASEARIKADYKVDKNACDAASGNAKDICIAQAKGKRDVASAELNKGYKPTQKNQYKLSVAMAEATYDVAKQKCDDLSGNPKDVCIKEAKAALTAAKADAKVKMTTSAVNATANETTADAMNKAAKATQEVRVDAAADKRAAQLKVAQEKCDALASSAKDACLANAKSNFGKL